MTATAFMLILVFVTLVSVIATVMLLRRNAQERNRKDEEASPHSTPARSSKPLETVDEVADLDEFGER